jgi:hypothetical protein
VDAGADAGRREVFLEPLAVRDPHRVEVVDRPRPGRHVGNDDRSCGVGEELIVSQGELPPLLVPLCQVAKLHAQEPRLDGVEPAVVALEIVEILRRLPVVAQHLATPRHRVVIGGDRPRLAAGPQILSRIEAECRGTAQGAGLAPPALLLREVLRTMCLAGVLEDGEVVLRGQLGDRIHVGHLAIQVNRDDGRHGPPRPLAHPAARPLVRCARGLQIGSQLLRSQGVRLLVDVDEIRPRARLRDRLRRGDEGERRRHHGVPRLDAGRHQGEPQGIGPAAHANAEPGLAKLRKVALELLDHGPADEAGGVEGHLHNRAQLFPEFAVNGDEIEKGNPTPAHAQLSLAMWCTPA